PDRDPSLRVARALRRVSDDNDGVAPAREILEERQHLGAALAVEGARGLVGQDDLATVHERPRNRHPLLLAARELRRLVLEPIAEAERRQQGAGALLALPGWHARVDGGRLDGLGGGGRADPVCTRGMRRA